MNDGDINELIAEKVMGWQRIGADDYVSPRHEFLFDDWENKGPHERLVSPNGDIFYICGCNGSRGIDSLPDYANDIAAAWQVVEKLITLPYWDGLSLEHVTHDWRLCNGDGWICAQSDSYQRDQGSGEIVAVALTLPRAICLAALKAVEYEDDENDEGIQGCLEDGTLGIRQDAYGNLYFGNK